ncbi:MAG: sigma-E processing peptidase SpoIIGA [Clostridia bacterium]|nr:sigma-E processing peptidase SpoIIGA [Clostridia bacterium]
MSTVIYADVLVAVNILITYILLVASRVLVKSDTNKYGVVFASLLGGFSSLVIFWENIPFIISVIYKISVGVAITCAAFIPKTKKVFIKSTLTFFFVNFVFGGIIYFAEISFNMSDVIYLNGVVYFDISLLFLVSMTLLSYGILLIFDYFMKKRIAENVLYEVEIFRGSESVRVTALYDTGNHLTDGIEGKPVIVCETGSIKDLFSIEELVFLSSENITDEVPESLNGKLRLIPCNSVTGSSVLKAIVPDKVIIRDSKTMFCTEFSVVAAVNGRLSEGEYNCLLNADVFERGKRINDILVEK